MIFNSNETINNENLRSSIGSLNIHNPQVLIDTQVISKLGDTTQNMLTYSLN